MDDLIFHHALNPDFLDRNCNATHSFADENELCGDTMTLDLEIVDGIIKNASFSGDMCMMSKAGADILLNYAVGKHIDTVKMITGEQVIELVSRTAVGSRITCFLLALKVFRKALTTEIV